MVKQRALSDTGYMCRNMLGFDYDLDDTSGQEVRPGGVRGEGPHKEMIDFLDDRSCRYKMIQAPRGSFKSTILVGYAIRRITENRNTRVLYCMKTANQARSKVGQISDLLTNQNLNYYRSFGDVKGKPWKRTEPTIAGRTLDLAQASVTCAGVDVALVGGHYDIIILDDLVDWDTLTDDKIQKTLQFYRMVQPLLDPGGEVLVTGTRYAHNELYGWLEVNQNEMFRIKKWDCGMRPVAQEWGGSYVLEGTPVFKHLTAKVLWEKFANNGYDVKDFCSQYCNIIVSGNQDFFFRSEFKPHQWEPSWMQHLSGFLLTDTATSVKDTANLSVAILVGLDGQDNVYVLDMLCGRMDPTDYVSQTVDMVERWMAQVDIRGITMEKTSANVLFANNFQEMFRRRKIRMPHMHKLSRSGSDEAKDQRIQRIQQRFRDGRIYFVDTLPRYYLDKGREKLLWDPEAYRDSENKDGPPLPGGELVDQFVYFRQGWGDDIADCLADVDVMDLQGRRICTGMGFRSRERQEHQAMVDRGIVRTMPMMIQGRERIVDIVPTEHKHNHTTWASRYAQKLKRRTPVDQPRPRGRGKLR